MSDKERLQLEQECLFKYSKEQVINLYLDELDKNKQLKSILNEIEYFVSNEYSFDEFGMKIIDKSKLEDKIQELKILGDKENE